MQNRSTYAAPRNSRTQRAISPINAAQRAGYNLDAAPASKPAQPAQRNAPALAQPSTASQPH